MAGGTQPRGGIIEGIIVTPLVEITLVLLLVFIVTAKMVVNPAVPVDLPQAAQSEAVQTILAVAITPDGALLADGDPCSEEELRTRARQALQQDKELRAVIQADGAVSHRRVMEVLDLLRGEGLTRVAFGAVKPETSGAGE